jgi:hypothetical protein
LLQHWEMLMASDGISQLKRHLKNLKNAQQFLAKNHCLQFSSQWNFPHFSTSANKW